MSEDRSEGSDSWAQELDQVISRVRQDRANMGQALLAEQAASADLRSKYERLSDDRSRAEQQIAQDAVKIDRLTSAALEIEHHYEKALADRDLEIGELRARQQDVADEWASRYRRLARGHEREIEAFTKELTSARTEIETLHVELSTERARTISSAPEEALTDQGGGTYVIEGDALALLVWPDMNMADSRMHLVDALEQYGEKTETNVEILFQSELGLEELTGDQEWSRVRVPHDGIPLELVIKQLYEVHSLSNPTMVATNRSGFARSVNLVRFAAQLGLRTPPSRPALEATTTLDFSPVADVVSIERS